MSLIHLTVEGGPFWVRPERIVALGEGWRELPLSADLQDDIRTGRVRPDQLVPEKVRTTLVTVEHVGSVPVDESVNEVLALIPGTA